MAHWDNGPAPARWGASWPGRLFLLAGGLAWGAVGPASASHVDLSRERGALASAAGACYASLRRATETALEKDKAALLLGLVEEGDRQAREAATAASTLGSRIDEALGRVHEAVLGRPNSPGAAKRLAAAESGAAAARGRWAGLQAELKSLKAKIEALPPKLPDGKPNPKRERLLQRHREAADRLEDAGSRLEGAEGRLKPFAAEARGAEAARKRAGGLREDFAGSSAEVARRSGEIDAGTAEAASRLSRLGSQPEALQRTRAWQALEPLATAAGQLRSAAEAGSNRAEEFERAASSALHAARRCGELDKAIQGALRDCGERLSDAESLAAEIAEALKKGD